MHLRPNSSHSLFVSNSFVFILALITAPVLSRIMGPEIRGEFYVTLALVTSFGAISNLGAGTIARREAYFLRSMNSELLLKVSLLAAFAMVLVWIISGTGFLELLGGTALLALLGYGALLPLYINLNAAALGRKQFGISALTMIIQPLFQLGAIAFHIISKVQMEVCLAIMVFIGLAAQTLVLHSSLRKTGRVPKGPGAASGTSGMGIKFFPKTVFRELRFRIDLLLVGAFLGPSAAGNYSVAITLSSTLLIFESWLVSRLYSFALSSNANTPKLDFVKAQMVIVAPLVAATVCGVALTPLIPTIFGDEFQLAETLAAPAFLLAAGVVSTSINVELLTGRGKAVHFLLPVIIIFVGGMALLLAWGVNLSFVVGVGGVFCIISFAISVGLLYNDVYSKKENKWLKR